MKKLLSVGMVSLMIFASSAVVYGAGTSLIGSKVQGIFSVSVNGKKISDAVAINGQTYVPVRSLTESIGADVKVEGKKVMVTTAEQSVDVGADEVSIILKGKIYGIETTIGTNQSKIKRLTESLESIEAAIKGNEASAVYKDFGIVYKDTQAYKDAASQVADYQSQIDVIKAEIADLEKQKEELTKQLEG